LPEIDVSRKNIIVTAATSGYFPLLEGLIGSILPQSSQVDIGVLDLGLTDAQRKSLKRQGVIVKVAKWDCDLSIFPVKPANHFKAMTARPNLPSYFPGYPIIVWLDCDSWVQDWGAVDLLIATAETTGFSIVPEIDRAYTPFLGDATVIEWIFSCYGRCFGSEAARQFGHYPLINSGVFAARSDAPHWHDWKLALQDSLKRLKEPYFFSEQTALNYTIRKANLPTAWLPSRCNWVCSRAHPMTRDGIVLIDPNPPYDTLGIVHLTGGAKNGRRKVMSPTGEEFFRSLRWMGHDDAMIGPDVTKE